MVLFFNSFLFSRKYMINPLLIFRDDMSKNEMKKPVLTIKEKRKLKKELDENKVIKPRKKEKVNFNRRQYD